MGKKEIMTILAKIFIELFPCLIIGYTIGKHSPKLSKFISKPLINYGAPISIAGILLGVGIEWQLIKSSIFAVILMTTTFVLIIITPKFSKMMNDNAIKLSCSVSNTAYFGIPIALALLPKESINSTIGFDLGSTLLTWTIGPFIISQNNIINYNKISNNVFKIFSSPAMKGCFLYFLIIWTPYSKMISEFIWLPSKIILLFSLGLVGMILSSTNFNFKSNQFLKDINFPLLIKLFLMPIIALLLSLFFNFNHYEIKALVIQSAGPSAISVLLISQAEGIKSSLLTKQILISTLLSIFTIPFTLIFLNQILT